MVKKFAKYYKPHLKLFIFDLICATLVAVIGLVFPIATNLVLKKYLISDKIQLVFIVGGLMLALYVIRFFLNYFIGYYGHIMGIRIETDMRRDLFHKLETLDYQFYDDNKTGVLMANLTTHLHDVSEMSHHAPEDLFISLLMLIGSFIILSFVNLYLTLIVFVFLIMLISYSLYRRKKMLERFIITRTAQEELNASVESSISGIRLTQAYTNDLYEEERFKKDNEVYLEARIKVFREIALFTTGNDFFINLANLSVLVFGGFFVYKEFITLIDLTTFFLYINFLIKPISRLTNSMEQMQQGFSGIKKFFNIMEMEPSIVNKEDFVIDEITKGIIEFENVDFHYHQDGEHERDHILKNFNLTIPEGKKIALVGETGVGKSTISKLVPRFYDVSGGAILIDGIDVRDYDVYTLRKAIGHVQQDVFIFYGTIKENILYGRVDATDEEVIAAAKKAQIHDFILTLEQGYETITGERGVKLSGGQKQRISIARLFLKDPKILILDEATSSLDNITEMQIQKALDLLSVGKTTITIAHRLSTIKNADEIIVLGKEGIIERGKHKDLVNSDGYYSDLYKATIAV